MTDALAWGGGILLAAAGLWFGGRWWQKARRRKRALARFHAAGFPRAWAAVLRRRMPVYARLPEEIRRRLEAQVKVFLAEKTFTACGGLPKVNDAMAVTIAGHACLLLAGRDGADCFPSVQSVLVYPGVFSSEMRSYDHTLGWEVVGTVAREGEASPAGSVVLAWCAVLQANALAGNGHNVVLHEFAHHVRPGGGNLPSVLAEGLRALRTNESEAVIDRYGAQNAEEFWAVSVEAFFEMPQRLHEAHPDLYRALEEFFALDPAEWERG